MGIDRIGKDTFIENNFPGHKKIHLTKPPEGVDPLVFSKTEYRDYFCNLAKNDGLVYNRGHIDEFVYAPIYRNSRRYRSDGRIFLLFHITTTLAKFFME